MSIPFVQYVRPHGRRRAIEIDRSQEIEALADTIARMGYDFEAEVLTTGQVSLTISSDEGETVAHEIVPNSVDVPPAVDALVRKAAERLEVRL